MARTSLKALEIPEGVTLEDNQGVITFTGKLGNMSLEIHKDVDINKDDSTCLLYTSPSPRDQRGSRMPSSA